MGCILVSGKRSAGNPHATFDAMGDGNGANKPPRQLFDPTIEEPGSANG